MIIDFHTHIFPDKIAGRTLDYLSDIFGASPFADGTHTGLCDSMKKAGVDVSVSLPAVTKVSQVESINRFASAFTEGAVISFGGIHPECENYKEILKEIKNLGLKGIKLHPDYQNTFFNDDKYLRIIDYAAEKDLGIIVHAGEDVGLPESVHCTPDMVLDLWKHIQPEKLILAHMGGWKMWNEVEEKLLGLPIYLDTAVVQNDKLPVKISDEQLKRMIDKHGADKILFGTDSPWYDQSQALKDFDRIELNEKDKKLILGENANRMFKFM